MDDAKFECIMAKLKQNLKDEEAFAESINYPEYNEGYLDGYAHAITDLCEAYVKGGV